MMGRVFGRTGANDEVIGILSDLTERVEEQNAGLIATNTHVVDVVKLVEGLRQYNEAMEVRIRKQNEVMIEQLQESFEEGMKTAVSLFKDELTKVAEMVKPQEVVKAIEKRSTNERKLRLLDANKSKLQSVAATYLVNDLPLVSEKARYKYPELTPQGEAVYKEVMRFITQLAKITGRNKEYYTNSDVYQDFFDKFELERYDRGFIRTSKGKQIKTLLAMIIVNGHIRQYINFIISLSDEESKKYARKEGGTLA